MHVAVGLSDITATSWMHCSTRHKWTRDRGLPSRFWSQCPLGASPRTDIEIRFLSETGGTRRKNGTFTYNFLC
jgi:hypothetical protein